LEKARFCFFRVLLYHALALHLRKERIERMIRKFLVASLLATGIFALNLSADASGGLGLKLGYGQVDIDVDGAKKQEGPTFGFDLYYVFEFGLKAGIYTEFVVLPDMEDYGQESATQFGVLVGYHFTDKFSADLRFGSGLIGDYEGNAFGLGLTYFLKRNNPWFIQGQYLIQNDQEYIKSSKPKPDNIDVTTLGLFVGYRL
jgi:hypothetical protein